ncbi:MAG TPA: patatin-like phospholipase family protein [Acidimicrobiales bacterium]|nr:patatin-like phospholipase family protein [Acidimicrobiales bacterium]
MPSNGTATGRPLRVGLVLGAGGVLGGAFHAGVLAALHEATGWDPRRASVIVGTSAGSVLAAALRAGLPPAELLARAEGRHPATVAAPGAAGTRPGPSPAPFLLRLRPGPGRTRAEVVSLLRSAALRPLSTRPLAILASLVPDGTVPADFIRSGIEAIAPPAWPDDPLWICAVRQRDGRRVVFGRDAFPDVAAAVTASCAIPGVFRPETIDGEPYVDGGVHSPTNADLLAGYGPDLVIVSSPMSMAGRVPRLAVDQPARRWSGALLGGEAAALRRRGAHVVAFQPTPDDLAVMGPNAMDRSRRADVARHARLSTLRRLGRADTRRRLDLLYRAG